MRADSTELKASFPFIRFNHVIRLMQLSAGGKAPFHNVWSRRSAGNRKAEDGHCVWYGTCENCVPGHADYNIAYDGPAKPMNPDDGDDLKAVCPELFEGLGNHKRLASI